MKSKPLLLFPFILVGALFVPTFWELYTERWETLGYHHAYFILPVFLLMLWAKRNTFPKIPFGLSLPSQLYCMGILLLGTWFFLVGWQWNYLALQSLAFVFILTGAIGFIFGAGHLKTAAIPLLYLLLLVPPPIGILDQITMPMRYASSIVSATILTWLHYPVEREGLLIHMQDHEIYLGEPCSGFRSLITLLSLGLIYLYFNRQSFRKNIVLFLTIIPLALFGNILRIVVLCLITFYFGEEAGQGFFHHFSGLFIFLLVTCGLLFLDKVIKIS